MRSYFPDINVWVALTYRGHDHHPVAASWFEHLEISPIFFCRLTQLGLLRLLTHAAVMRDEVRTQSEAWNDYALLRRDGRVNFCPEPETDDLENEWRSLTRTSQVAPQQWSDAYLVSFARVVGLTLVTFDQALGTLAGKDVVLLRVTSHH
jgi:uncharacterized protein